MFDRYSMTMFDDSQWVLSKSRWMLVRFGWMLVDSRWSVCEYWRGLTADAADLDCRQLVRQLEASGIWIWNQIGDGIIEFSIWDDLQFVLADFGISASASDTEAMNSFD